MNKLNKKRKRVFLVILAATSGNAIVIATPSIDIESAKYVILAIASVAMFIIVWDFYFDEQLSQKSIRLILQDLLTITGISLVTSFAVFKGITKVTNYLTTAFGSSGWSIAGAIAGLITAILGIIWASYCDDLYRNSN